MKITMKDIILKHLKEKGTITSWEAIIDYGCTRLGHYIWLLKKEGYTITGSTVKTTTRYGISTHFKQYQLVGGAEDVK